MKSEDKAGWIEWSGGPCPVDPYALVEARLQDHVGFEEHVKIAGDWYWGRKNDGKARVGNIIAFRLVTPPASSDGE